MQVYSSFPNIMNFQRSNISMTSIYKRYALMYDEIIFNRHGCPIGDGSFFSSLPEYISSIVSDESELPKKLALGKNNKFKNLFIDMWDIVDDPENVHTEARNYISENDQIEISNFSWGRNLIDEEMGIQNHRREYKAAAIVGSDITSDLGFNFLLKEKLDSFKVNLAPVISDVFKSTQETSNINSLFTTDLIIPNFEALSWDQILELREDNYIKEFRKKIMSLSNSNEKMDEALSRELTTSLWSLADQCKPNMSKSILEVVLSNLPSPTIVNPFGLYCGVKNVIDTKKNKDEHSWVYFVQSMKNES